MALAINGTTGISGVDGSASAPAIVGSDSNTGLSFASDILRLNTAGEERIKIQSDGDIEFNAVGDGTPGSGNTLVGMAFEPRNGTAFLSRSNSPPLRLNINTTNQDILQFRREGSLIGRVYMQTSTVSYATTSDYRVKENQVLISDGITRLKTLKPYRFNFKEDPSKTVDGFFAHEVTAVPEAITGTKDEVDSDNNPVYQGIDQSKLVPLLTAALQEAVTKIETLETKVAALEAA